jgi:PAS domain S-box-containing protein
MARRVPTVHHPVFRECRGETLNQGGAGPHPAVSTSAGRATQDAPVGRDDAAMAHPASFDFANDRSQAVIWDLPVAALLYDPATLQILAVSHCACRIYGYSHADFLERTIADIRPAEDRADLLEHLRDAVATPQEGRVWRHLTAAGDLLHVRASASPCIYAGREARLVVISDARAQVETEQRLRHAVALHADGVFDWDAGQARLAWNGDFLAWSGIDAAEVRDDLDWFLTRVHEQDREIVQRAFLDLAPGATRMPTVGFRLLVANGAWRHVAAGGVAVCVAEGEGVRVAGSLRDVGDPPPQ